MKNKGGKRRKENIDALSLRFSDHDPDVRMKVAERLGIQLAGSKKCPRALVKMLHDPNELVRIEVVDSLAAIGDRGVLPNLWMAIRDRSPLVRSYIAGAIGELGSKEDLKRLERKVGKERSRTAKLGYYQALYLLGKNEIFPTIVRFLRSKNYRLRCSTANILSEFIVDHSNYQSVLSALRKALTMESTVAAKSTFEACIRSIKKRFKE